VSESAVKSARRAFEILEAFHRHRRPLSLKELLDELGYPASSGSALLKSIVAMGYLDYDRERRTYFPTMRMAALGSWVEEALFGDGHLLALMEDLHATTGETVILGAQSDLHAQYIHLIHSAEPLHFAVPPGTRRPLARSGMGWVLLSAKRDAEIEPLLRRINAVSEPAERLTLDDLMAQIDAVRAQGYAFSRHTVSEGVGIIAAALPSGPFGRAYALGVAGPVARLDRKEAAIVEAIRGSIDRFQDQGERA
jgi:DNA-binding IclR family transcriptional regulator